MSRAHRSSASTERAARSRPLWSTIFVPENPCNLWEDEIPLSSYGHRPPRFTGATFYEESILLHFCTVTLVVFPFLKERGIWSAALARA